MSTHSVSLNAACTVCHLLLFVFFFNDTATTEIYTLSLHDALPISFLRLTTPGPGAVSVVCCRFSSRSEEHTSELQSLAYLVCRLLLDKKRRSSCHSSPIWTLLPHTVLPPVCSFT